MFAVFLRFLALVQSYAAASSVARTLCRDAQGRYVDWWIIIKRSGSAEYVCYSSFNAWRNEPPRPLSPRFRIDDPATSPILRTVYDSEPQRNKDNEGTNNIILAWNDQQPHDRQASESAKKKRTGGAPLNSAVLKPKNLASNSDELRIRSRYEDLLLADEALKETQLGSGKVMDGSGENEDFAHSKGILGLGVPNVPSNGNGRAQVEMYLITHSFPRIPNGADWQEDEPIKRQYIPRDPKDFFGTNITGTSSKAQHALCISMTQKVQVVNGEIVFDRNNLDRRRMNLFSILDGLDIIGPSMTLTNYVPWLTRFRIYHQLFDIRSSWSASPITDKEKIYNLNVARATRRTMQTGPVNVNYSQHAFPLWPHKSRIVFDGGVIVEGRMGTTLGSLRDSGQLHRTRCRVWKEADGERKDAGCYATATLTSTNLTSGRNALKPLVLHVDFKHSRVTSDTDDFIAARLLPLQDLELAASVSKGPKTQVSMVVVHQSWFDHATFGSHARTIVDTDRFMLQAWFHNNLATRLPNEDGTTILQPSNMKDHSKWFVSYLYAQLGTYQPVAGVTDLNRNAKHTRLNGREYGRAGMFFFSHMPHFVAFFMSLAPIIEGNSNFTNTPLAFFTDSQAAIKETKMANVASVAGINAEGTAIRLKFENERIQLADKVMLPYCVLPSEWEEIMCRERRLVEQQVLLGEKTPTRSKSFVTGDHFTADPSLSELSWNLPQCPRPRPQETLGALMPIYNFPPGPMTPYMTFGYTSSCQSEDGTEGTIAKGTRPLDSIPISSSIVPSTFYDDATITVKPITFPNLTEN